MSCFLNPAWNLNENSIFFMFVTEDFMLKIIIHVIFHYYEVQLYIVKKLSLVVFYNVNFFINLYSNIRLCRTALIFLISDLANFSLPIYRCWFSLMNREFSKEFHFNSVKDIHVQTLPRISKREKKNMLKVGWWDIFQKNLYLNK